MSVKYRVDDQGRWFCRKTLSNCPEVCEGFMGCCQGVTGHRGFHWAYLPSGSFAFAHQSPAGGRVFATVLPPDHDDYPHPMLFRHLYYKQFSLEVEVTDRDLIRRLECGEVLS